VLIDFGLAYTSTLDEDKAVDLYVLERALGATHPDGGVRFARILDGYGTAAGPKAWARVNGRLQDGALPPPVPTHIN
jgi:TP53 regulating kinase-like protein